MRLNLVPMYALLAVMTISATADLAVAQRGGRGGPPGMNSALFLLGDEKVQQELELVGNQIEAIEEMMQEQRTAMRESFMGIREKMEGASDDERETLMKEIREDFTSKMKEVDEKAYGELLPHQVDRLKQLVVQSQGQRGGGISSGRISDTLKEQLNITEEQEKALQEKAESVRADLEEKMAKLRSQAETEVLSVLDEGQRSKLKELMGDKFEFDNGGRGGDRGGRGGDRGGRGGDRGGRGGDRGGERPDRPATEGEF